MRTSPSPQLAPAMALVELLKTHPDLADHITWSIPRIRPYLIGCIHDGGMAVLADCAEFLGGSIRAADDTSRSGDRLVQQHVLSSTWHDVRVEVSVTLPVPAVGVAA